VQLRLHLLLKDQEGDGSLWVRIVRFSWDSSVLCFAFPYCNETITNIIYLGNFLQVVTIIQILIGEEKMKSNRPECLLSCR